MVINNFHNINPYYLRPNKSMIFIFGYGFVRRSENQTIWLVQIAGPLAFPVVCQFVIMTWQITHILKRVSGCQLTDTAQKQIRSFFSELLFAHLLIGCVFL